jgi:hypothetical protein
MRQMPLAGALPVIELPTLLPIEQMIQTGQSHCSINGVVIQNGVTTNQVLLFASFIFHALTITCWMMSQKNLLGKNTQTPCFYNTFGCCALLSILCVENFESFTLIAAVKFRMSCVPYE